MNKASNKKEESIFISNFEFSKKLGQNFLINSKTKERILNSIRSFVLSSDQNIIEIGPGMGAITKLLCERNKVIAIELDKKLFNYLISQNINRLKIINDDCLKIDINSLISNNDFLFSNTPYSITTAIINKFIVEWNFNDGILLMQAEVSDRILSNTKDKKYSAFTVFCKTFLDINKLFDIQSKDFYPEPKILSTLVYLKKKSIDLKIDKTKYWNFLKLCFLMRRKKIINNLKTFCSQKIIDILIKKFNLENKRSQELTIQDFINIYKEYEKNN